MNKYCNLDGTKKINEDYPNITSGFEKVQLDTDSLQGQITANKTDIEGKLNTEKENLQSQIDADNANLQTHKDSSQAHNAANIPFTPGTSGIVATNADGAIKEIKQRVEQIITTPISGAAATQEVVDARNSAIKSTVYASLDARLEASETDIEATKVGTISTPATVTAPVNVLSSNAVKSMFSDLEVRGNTDTNIITNGNFANGTTGWTATGGTGAVASNVYSLTANGSSSNAVLVQNPLRPFVGISGHKIYVGIKCRVTNSSASLIQSYVNDGTDSLTVKVQSTPTANQWYPLSGIATLTRNSSFGVWVMEAYADAATANGKVIEVKEVMAIDLTARFGAGNEPDAATCDKRYAYWFDGTKHTGARRVRVTGKNLTDGNLVSAGNLSVTSEMVNGIGYWKLTASGSGGSGNTFPLNIRTFKPNTQYTLSYYGYQNTVGKNLRLIIRHTDGTTIGTTLETTESRIVTQSTAGKTVDGISWTFTDNTSAITYIKKGSFQIEEGVTATTYEPYTAQDVYVTWPQGTGKSLPNGVCDVVDVVKGEEIQKVSDIYTLKASDITSLSTSSTNIDIVIIRLPAFTSYAVWGDTTNHGQIRFDDPTYIWKAFADNIANVNTFYYGNSVGNFIGLCVANDTYANLAAAQAALAGKTLYYQLTTPVTTKIFPRAIESIPNGSIISEPIIFDVGYYRTKIDVANTAYPIKALSFVNRINTNTGELTPVDLTTCTVASDGLSFTITGAADNTYYEYGYSYDTALSTLDTLYYTYPTNIRAAVEELADGVKGVDSKVDETGKLLGERLLTVENAVNTSTLSAKSTVTQAVTTLPNTMVRTPFQDMEVRGNTRNNPIKSSNMNVDTNADGVVDDFSSGAGMGNTVTFSLEGASQKIDITASTGTQVAYVKQIGLQVNAGEIISVRFEAKGNGNVDIWGSLDWKDSGGAYITQVLFAKSTPSSFVEFKLENRTAPANTAKADLFLYVSPKIAGDTGTGWFKNAMLEKATSVGNYISSGTKHTGAQRVRVTGKNLFDGILEKGTLSSTGAESASTTVNRTKGYISVKPSQSYCFSGYTLSGSSTIYIYEFDKDLNFISRTASNLITTSASTRYLRFWYVNDNSIISDKLQLEFGSTVTAYEPYTSKDIFINWPQGSGKSLPNGVYDSIDLLKGEAVQRTGQVILNGTENWANDITYTNTYRFSISGWCTSNNALQGMDSTGIGYCSDGNYPVFASSSLDSRSISLGSGVPNGFIYVKIEKAKVDAMAGADITAKGKAYFAANPITLVYQLTTPVISKVSGIGGLIYNPNGSILVEPIIKDEAVYNNGITNSSGFAIKSLSKVQKVVILADNSRQYVDIDLTTCTVAGDGLSFTSTALANGNTVYWEASYDSALSTLPTLAYSYPMNLSAECNRNTEEIGKLYDKIRELSEIIALLDSRLTAHSI